MRRRSRTIRSLSMRLVLIGGMALSALAASASAQDSEGKRLTLKAIRASLGGQVTFKTLTRDNGALLISPELGGKIIGVSTEGPDGPNLFFTHARLLEPGFLEEETDFFNPGGDRCWIAPSGLFNLDADGVFRIPTSVDPGHYVLLESSPTRASMSSRFQVEDSQGNNYDLELRRDIEMLDTPRDDGSEVQCVAYRCNNRLINHADQTLGEGLPLVSLKTFLEVTPPGEIIVPLAEPGTTVPPHIEYKDTTPVEISGGALHIRLDGGLDSLRQKLGFSPDTVTGRLAFIAETAPGASLAIVRLFPIDPAGRYIENADEATGKPGDAIQIYDDNGGFGGFAEMEELGPVKPLGPGEELSHPVTVYVLTGPSDGVSQATDQLLGIKSASNRPAP